MRARVKGGDWGAPIRPSVTPLFGIALAFWIGCANCYSRAIDVDGQTCLAVAVSLGIAGAVFLLVSFALKRRLVAFVVVGALFGSCIGMACAATVHGQEMAALAPGKGYVELDLVEDVRDNGYSKRALARIVSGQCSGMRVIAEFAEGGYRYGQHVEGYVSFSRFSEKGREYGWQRGAACNANVSDANAVDGSFPLQWLTSIRSRAIDAIGSSDDEHALLQALACGYRESIRESSTYATFQICGLAHLVAVSGAHLVIVTGLVATMLKALRCSKRASIALLVTTMAAYLAIAGMPVSAVRAIAMSALGLFSFYGRRRSSSMNALGIGIIAIVCINPASSVSPSFALSALSTIGIVVFSPLFAYLVRLTPLGRVAVVADSIALTVSASLLSQLYASSLFNMLPLVSPLANVIAAPLFPIACSTGILAALAHVAHLSFAGLLLNIASGCSRALEIAVATLAQVPYACVPFAMDAHVALMLSGTLSCTLWAVWPCDMSKITKSIPLCAAVLAIPLLLFTARPDCIVMLDVGQGDSFLVESKGKTLLIDTGNQDKMLLEELGRLQLRHLDGVLVTHADDDHCGSLDVIARTVEVERVILAEGMVNEADESCKQLVEMAGTAAHEVITVSYGDSFSIGAFDAHVVWPREFTDAGGNADSLCVLLEYDGDEDGSVDFTAFFTGDAEMEQVAKMVDAGDVGKVDILKVGHHGSKNGLSESEVEALKPTVALIGVGRGNRYGHPSGAILELLENAGCRVYRSDRDGEVRCMLWPECLKVAVVG